MAEPLRIALLTHSVNPRGGVVHVLELARALHEAGHAVTVFAPAEPGQALFRPVPHAVSYVPQPATGGSTAERVAERIALRIAAYAAHLRTQPLDRFDVLHAHDAIGANALADLGRRFVRTVHHLDPFDDPRLAAWQQRSIDAAAQLLCVSPLWQRTLRNAHGRDAALVANGVDLARFGAAPAAGDAEVAAAYGLRPGAPLWLMVGGVEARKNTLRGLQAFGRHRRAHPHAQLVIAGGASLLDHGAYQRAFDTALAASGAADAVRLTGTVPDAEMPALFRLADGLLMPSLREGFGLVVLEALASGTPVVVSRQPPFTEYLADGDAHWADPLEPASIAAAMARALAAPPITTVPTVCRRHSWAASAARHVALYRALAVPA